MPLHNLQPAVKKNRKRVGRGNSSGRGTYATRGGDGQKSRSGHKKVRMGFEGGQTPLIQRMPKHRGFRNPNRVETQAISLDMLSQKFAEGDTVSAESLTKAGLMPTKKSVKILNTGEINKKLVIDGIALSKTAQASIEKAGGEVR